MKMIKDVFFENRQTARHLLGIIVALSLIVLCLFMMKRIDKRFIFSIDSMEFSGRSELTVGAGSDLAMISVPHDFMSIGYDDKGFSWSIDTDRDSLCYYQINGKNPNRHELGDESRIHTAYTTPDGNKMRVDLTGKDIIDCVRTFKETEYTLLRNIIVKLRGDSVSMSAKGDKSLASVIRKDPKTQNVDIIILDNQTTLNDTLGYVYRGHTSELIDARPDECKIQFFKIVDFSVRFTQTDKALFHLEDINYMVKPVLLLTEWGAGHYLLRRKSDNSISVNYPKGLMYVERFDTLESISKKRSDFVTLKQNATRNMGDNVFIPTFSSAFSPTICYVNMREGQFQIESCTNDSFKIASQYHLVPTLQRASLRSGDLKVNCRYGVLDMKYIMSYFVPTLIMLLLIMMAHVFFVYVRESAGHDSKERSKWTDLYATYLPALALVATTYCTCKIMITLKLSYTYPYFEKLTGVVVISASLVLLLFYLLSLFINFDFIQAPASLNIIKGKKKGYIALLAPCIAGTVGLFVAFLFLRMTDAGVNTEVKASYFPYEWFSYNVFSWTDKAGINDTHRSVLYTLFLASAVLTAVLFGRALLTIALCGRKKTRKTTQSVFDNIDGWLDKFAKQVIKEEELRQSRPFWLKKILVYLLRYVAIPAALIYAIGLLRGNFATAFITFFTVTGLAYALSGIDYEDGPLTNLVEIVVASGVLLFMASIPDHGYITNAIGVFVAAIMFYLLMQKRKYSFGASSRERKRDEKVARWLPRIVLGGLLLVVLSLFAYSRLISPEDVDYGRSNRRFQMASQFEQYRESGYRYADSDTEFMNILFYYMSNKDGRDPLSNEKHHLHPSISTGQSPVILNDVSLPSSFFSSYGKGAYVVYFSLLSLLLFLVFTYSLSVTTDGETVLFDRYSQWRLIAVLMWVGSSMYLYISYHGALPFTGRLNPGMGVDAVGEALESSILLAFMTATIYYKKDRTDGKGK